MFYAYIIKNNSNNKHYIGSTNNLVRRLDEHNRGQTHSTRNKGVWTMIYSEPFPTIDEAKQRERQIKSYKGGNAFKKLFEK